VVGGAEAAADETAEVTALAAWETAAVVDAIAVPENAEVKALFA
jgi:hypothetical protein